jgi:hypothetical protein
LALNVVHTRGPSPGNPKVESNIGGGRGGRGSGDGSGGVARSHIFCEEIAEDGSDDAAHVCKGRGNESNRIDRKVEQGELKRHFAMCCFDGCLASSPRGTVPAGPQAGKGRVGAEGTTGKATAAAREEGEKEREAT